MGSSWPALSVMGIMFCLFLAEIPGSTQAFEDDVIGALSTTPITEGETLSDIARIYNLGYTEIRIANSDVDPWLPEEGSEVMIPNMHVLPDTSKEGIVINVPEMRMYVYDNKSAGGKVATFPISVGRQDWTTPHGEMQVSGKLESPAWYPPASILREHAEMGEPLPRVVGPGPDNPLGKYALLLSTKGYLIHGTNKPYGIGMRVTHGCIRMYPKHIKTLFSEVKAGVKVSVIDQAIKVGLLNGVIFMEVHPSFDENALGLAQRYAAAMNIVHGRFGDELLKMSHSRIQQMISEQTGVPSSIGFL